MTSRAEALRARVSRAVRHRSSGSAFSDDGSTPLTGFDRLERYASICDTITDYLDAKDDLGSSSASDSMPDDGEDDVCRVLQAAVLSADGDAPQLVDTATRLRQLGYRHDERCENASRNGSEETALSTLSVIKEVLREARKHRSLISIPLPASLLLPMSATEKASTAMRNGEMLALWACEQDPLERFLAGMSYFLSGVPKEKFGKKPYNPVLGETYQCVFAHRDPRHGVTVMLCEQVSHHPPRTATHLRNEALGVRMNSFAEPRPKLWGNSLEIELGGCAVIELTRWNGGEVYVLTRPTLWLTGVLGIGKRRAEWIGKSSLLCPQQRLRATFEFKGRCFGGISGEANVVEGSIYRDDERIYRFGGRWDRRIQLREMKTGATRVLYDCEEVHRRCRLRAWIPPLAALPPTASERVWQKVSAAILQGDYELASAEKQAVEEQHRRLRAQRQEAGMVWKPVYFEEDVQRGEYRFRESMASALAWDDHVKSSSTG
ncbi:hypothetical protein CDCA_CDCA03G0936 [Cyanidium caldarium]|uniref:Oxysterol-binding protein n=1 Tax=Cyanidium caldarium TaxID=2771 RepID=A0AAV9IS66_CYACA|nr:hypothetical protein CDCA_CDCA03G0936 [Cyanidium caldarium]|eukprot:ctg_769.g380